MYLKRYDVYAVGRLRDVRGVLRDWQTFTSADGVAFNDLMNEAEMGTAPGSDPPEHDAIRSAMLERLRRRHDPPRQPHVRADRIGQP